MKKPFLTISLIIFVAVLLFTVYVKIFIKYPSENIDLNDNLADRGSVGIKVNSIQPYQLISSPLLITGTVTGNGWTGFEGQVGTVKLQDSTGKELALGILTATGNWMQLPTNFETSLNFVSLKEDNGYLVFHNENASGELERDKTYTIPVKLPKMDTMQVSVFFNKFNQECEDVTAVKRLIQKTNAPARASLEELLRGPYFNERQDYSTNINSGVRIQSLSIDNGVAHVDFNDLLETAVAGSCRVLGIRSQIEKTLLQFDTIKSVVISIDGRVDDILQP